MSRAFRRAQIPLWFTEGYNPHLFMTFARPLSLGQESLCECVDVRLTGEMTFKEIKSRMNDALVPGITIVSVAKPVHKPTEIAFADYEIKLFTDEPETVHAALETGLSKAQILVTKKAKQGRRKIDKEIDIKTNVISAEVSKTENGILLLVRLTAGDQNTNKLTLLRLAACGEAKNTIAQRKLLTKSNLVKKREHIN